MKIYSCQLAGQLLLDENLAPDEGTMDRLISNVQDFDRWKADRGLRGKIRLVSDVDDLSALDADEHFDYCTPTPVLRRFFEITPDSIVRSPWCDLRLNAFLDRLTSSAVLFPLPWLLAHYKVTFQAGAATDEDRELARRFKMQPTQIAACRQNVESSVVQFLGWDEEKHREFRRFTATEINRAHGVGLGDALWSRACERFKCQ